MVIRIKNGELIVFNKYDFKNDRLYYSQIMSILKSMSIHK